MMADLFIGDSGLVKLPKELFQVGSFLYISHYCKSKKLFCRNFAFALQGCVECVPAQACALDACGEFENAGEYLQPPEVIIFRLGIEFAGDHSMKFIEDHFGLLTAFALDELRHHRRRRLRDRTARTLERNIRHGVAVEFYIDAKCVAAKRIVTVSRAVGRFDLTEITRILVVFEDDLLIKFVQFGHRLTTSRPPLPSAPYQKTSASDRRADGPRC